MPLFVIVVSCHSLQRHMPVAEAIIPRILELNAAYGSQLRAPPRVRVCHVMCVCARV